MNKITVLKSLNICKS